MKRDFKQKFSQAYEKDWKFQNRFESLKEKVALKDKKKPFQEKIPLPLRKASVVLASVLVGLYFTACTVFSITSGDPLHSFLPFISENRAPYQFDTMQIENYGDYVAIGCKDSSNNGLVKSVKRKKLELNDTGFGLYGRTKSGELVSVSLINTKTQKAIGNYQIHLAEATQEGDYLTMLYYDDRNNGSEYAFLVSLKSGNIYYLGDLLDDSKSYCPIRYGYKQHYYGIDKSNHLFAYHEIDGQLEIMNLSTIPFDGDGAMDRNGNLLLGNYVYTSDGTLYKGYESTFLGMDKRIYSIKSGIVYAFSGNGFLDLGLDERSAFEKDESIHQQPDDCVGHWIMEIPKNSVYFHDTESDISYYNHSTITFEVKDVVSPKGKSEIEPMDYLELSKVHLLDKGYRIDAQYYPSDVRYDVVSSAEYLYFIYQGSLEVVRQDSLEITQVPLNFEVTDMKVDANDDLVLSSNEGTFTYQDGIIVPIDSSELVYLNMINL